MLSQSEAMEQYVPRFIVYSLIWSFTGDAKLSVRNELGDFVRSASTIGMPPENQPLIDFEVFRLNYSRRKNNCQEIYPAHSMITKRDSILRSSVFVRHISS